MDWIVVVSVLAVLQFFFFTTEVGRARHRYGIAAPAVSGNELFERYFRVQMNTLELLAMFLPSLWLASLYVKPQWPALAGLLYLVGRLLYWRGYVASPAKRGPGYGLSVLPILVLALTALIGAVMRLAQAMTH